MALALLAVAAPARSQELSCLIQPNEIVLLSAGVEGIVERIDVDRGDLVEQGQVVAALESSAERAALAVAKARAELEAALKSAEVRVEFGNRRLTRTLDMYKKDLVPTKEMDEAETGKILADLALLEAHEGRRLAELELQRATAALALRTIRSPVTAVVVERSLAVGEATTRSPILKLAQIDPLRVEVFVPVAMLAKVRPGMRAQVMPEAPVSGVHSARVTVVDRVVDAASGTFGVRLQLPNKGYRLAAGLKCTVRFLGD